MLPDTKDIDFASIYAYMYTCICCMHTCTYMYVCMQGSVYLNNPYPIIDRGARFKRLLSLTPRPNTPHSRLVLETLHVRSDK
jgi:hypothetical protein